MVRVDVSEFSKRSDHSNQFYLQVFFLFSDVHDSVNQMQLNSATAYAK